MIDRREAFKVLGGGAAATCACAQHHAAQKPGSQPPPLRFFNERQNAVVDRLADIVIPDDDYSPGAHAAKVSHYIDLVLHYGDQAVRDEWTRALASLESRNFLGLDRAAQTRIVAAMAANETKPASDMDRFFVRLKRLTVDGYQWSEVGARENLKFRGDSGFKHFPGCTHKHA